MNVCRAHAHDTTFIDLSRLSLPLLKAVVAGFLESAAAHHTHSTMERSVEPNEPVESVGSIGTGGVDSDTDTDTDTFGDGADGVKDVELLLGSYDNPSVRLPPLAWDTSHQHSGFPSQADADADADADCGRDPHANAVAGAGEGVGADVDGDVDVDANADVDGSGDGAGDSGVHVLSPALIAYLHDTFEPPLVIEQNPVSE